MSQSSETGEDPEGPDIDLPVPSGRAGGLIRAQLPVMSAVALGGGVGAAARYGTSLVWPGSPGEFPWTTWGTNVSGCAVIGVFTVVISETRSSHRMLRPFLGIGAVGTFTSFSSHLVETRQLLRQGLIWPGLLYPVSTLLAILAVVWLVALATRVVLRGNRRRRRS